MTLTFSKYHGAGNDFILTADASVDTDRISELCQRSYGIGADGLITVTSLEDDSTADIRMVIYNADGTRPEMCANGLRCATRYWIEQKSDTEVEALAVRTDAGIRHSAVVDKGPSEWSVQTYSPLPVEVESHVDVSFQGKIYTLCYVQLGNPHAVLFGSDFDRTEIRDFGRYLNQRGEPFPDGVNVFYGEIDDGRIEGAVYERGVGFTEACGTGAVAAAVAARRIQRIHRDQIDVELPGGRLTIQFDKGSIGLIGPVVSVFRGKTG